MGRVLLLNATYEPLQLVSPRRAVLLIVDDRAEAVVVPAEPTVFHSLHLSIEVPSVLRLFHVVKMPSRTRTPPMTRRSVLQRDRHTCAYCGSDADTIDHIRPRSRGGRNEWTNVVAACRNCNFRKGDRMLEELGWRLRVNPVAPDGYGWRWRDLAECDPMWSEYLPKAS